MINIYVYIVIYLIFLHLINGSTLNITKIFIAEKAAAVDVSFDCVMCKSYPRGTR